jgi:hypothetical protein
MNKVRIQSVLITILLLVTLISTTSLISIPSNVTQSITSNMSLNEMAQDVLIIYDPSKYAYFGWYRPTQFSIHILDLLNRTISWASSHSVPSETRIIFFSESNNSYATFVREWLVDGGYLSENILNYTSSDIEVFTPDYYDSSDLVIYWNIYGYDPTNVINSMIPFITISAMQSDEMGIGSGIVSESSHNDTFYIVNNGYYPTETYPLGSILLDDSYRYEATEASSRAKVLVKAEVPTDVTKVKMSTVENVTIQGDGSADLSFTLSIPESPLAEALREAFFYNTSSLQKDVEYEVPENKTISYTSTSEQAIKDVTLLGDVSGDDQVDTSDLEIIAEYLGYTIGDQEFNSTFDLNWDGRIDMRDVALAARNHGKTIKNTGSLYISGYYDGELVNCTNVIYRGPEESLPINISESGHVWYYLLPGEYRINGTYNSIERSTNITVVPGKVVYAQLDFGGAAAPAVQSEHEPVKEVYHQGIVLEQLILLGFDINVTESKIIPYSINNETIITLTASSSQLAEITSYPSWQIKVGPATENLTALAAEFIFTKIQYMMLMLQSIPGEQIYQTTWQIGFDLPIGSALLNEGMLQGLNWTVDFGEGTFMQANVSVSSGRVIVDEILVVTERNITATEEYLAIALGKYRTFSINYTYSGGFFKAERNIIKLDGDWSKKWTYTIAPGSFQKTINFGPLGITLKATPTLATEWYMGWERKWTWSGYKLKWFECWMKITPSIKVEASATVTASYSKTWSYTFWTWSTRFTFWIGGLVVWANLKLQVTGRITLDAYGRISVSTWAKASAWYKAGIRWENGWSTIWNHGSGARRGTPVISGSAGLTITPSASCRLSFLLYDVGGPFVEATPYAPISINYYTSQPNTWSISLKLKISVGVTLAGWLKKIIKINEYSKTVADFNLMSWNGNW